MESWQDILRKAVRQNKTFTLKDKERNEFKLMKYFLEDTIVRKQLITWLENLGKFSPMKKKNIAKCEDLRKIGNKEFQDKKYASSIKYYTLSLQYAPADSEDLPLALANRSAALFYLERYEDCVKDIELALEYHYPKNMHYKLYLRAAQSYLKLHKRSQIEDALCKVHECLENNSSTLTKIKENVEKQIDVLLSELLNQPDNSENESKSSASEIKLPEPVYGCNPELPNASKAVDLKYTAEKGRHVVANTDIKKGQILFVEKPFAFVLLDNDDSEFVCANCCALKGDVPVPCKYCTATSYCSAKCQKEAWSTCHQYECHGYQVGMWDQIGIAHLTVKTFLSCCYTDDKYKFNKIQELVTNINEISAHDMFVYGISSLMMSLYLSKFTSFFEKFDVYEGLFLKFENKELNIDNCFDIPNEKWNANFNMLYVSGLLLRHMLQLICNGHAITRLNLAGNEGDYVVTEYQCRVATAIYPSASMMNHSCDPNIINSFKDQWLIVKATKDIPAGGEVLNCYGPHYRRMRKKDRQTSLKNQYCFTCECEACTQRALQNFSDRFVKLNCEDCGGPIEIMGNSNSMYCIDCETTFDLVKSKLYELEEANRLYECARLYARSNKIKEALEKAKQCLEIRKRILYEYHESIAMTYDLIGKILAMMGQWLQSITYLEYSIAAVEERYGSDSIELAHELNKITDICIRYLREETNMNTKQFKNTLKKTRRLLNRAEEILNLNYGPWNEACREITEKQEDLVPLLKTLNL